VQHLAVKAAVAEVTDLGEFTAIAAVFGNVTAGLDDRDLPGSPRGRPARPRRQRPGTQATVSLSKDRKGRLQLPR
jgi:hypothetical protein